MKKEGVFNIPLLDIHYFPKNIDLHQYNALIFTSKNAIYSLNSFNKEWKSIPSYVIAHKTEKVLIQEGGMVEFVGHSNNGNDFANELKNLLKNKKVLYIRAKKILSNLVAILRKNNIDIDEIVTYETKCNNCKDLIQIPQNSIIIFSSPSTIQCFFNLYTWDKTYEAIVIGETTAQYLPNDISYKISKTQSIDSCIDLAKKISKHK